MLQGIITVLKDTFFLKFKLYSSPNTSEPINMWRRQCPNKPVPAETNTALESWKTRVKYDCCH